MGSKLALGIDAGGTSVRAMLIDEHGALVGTGRGGPGNPTGGDRETALENIASASREALGGIDPGLVTAVCAGTAGVLTASEQLRVFAVDLAERLGTGCEVEVVGDPVIALAAGTDSPDGTVVISGTGAVAFAVKDRFELTGRADGHGWLLGDAGSGFWIGREAVAATLRHLDGGGPGGTLAEAIVEAIAPGERRALALVSRCMAEPPVRLARFASLVCGAAEGGDAVAASIVDRAVAHLAETVAAVVDPALPIVMAGSLLTRPTPVATGLAERFRLAYPEAELGKAEHPVVGAAWLAARRFGLDEKDHRNLRRELAWP